MSNTVPEPPEAAVASDPHWAAKMARLRARKPMERSLTLHDDESQDLVDAGQRAHVNLLTRLRPVLTKVVLESQPGLSPEDLRAVVQRELDVNEEVLASLAEVHALEKARDEADVTMVFRALPGDVYSDLQSEHPPTDEMQAKGMEYNVKTFVPALIAACVTDPMTEEEASELVDALNQGEAALMFQTAIAVNQGARASMGKDSRPTPS